MEPVGLTLGAIALVSLFSSCVEILEYFELGRSYEYDYEKACLKLSLLQQRLHKWGVTEVPYHDNAGAYHWRDEVSEKGVIISSALRGIYDILSNAELLRTKYCLFPNKRRPTLLTWTSKKGRKAKRKPLSELQPSQTNLTRRSTTCSTTWAIRDKRKFDGFITDLDFFITCLERLSLEKGTGIQDVAAITLTAMSEQKQEATPDQTASGQDRSMGDSAASSSAQANTKAKRDGPARPMDPTSRKLEESHCTYEVVTVNQNGSAFLGSIDGAPLAASPPGQNTTFRTELVTGNGRLTAGGMSLDAYALFMQHEEKKKKI